jgi:hypothetical protein
VIRPSKNPKFIDEPIIHVGVAGLEACLAQVLTHQTWPSASGVCAGAAQVRQVKTRAGSQVAGRFDFARL